MPPRGSFGVLTHAQGAAEGVRNRDNPPPQPRPVEAHLTTAMRSPLGAPGGRWNGERAPMGGGCVLLAPHRAPSVRTGALTEGWPAQGLSRGRSAPSAVSRSRSSGSQWETLVSYENGRGLSPSGTSQHQICLVRPFLSQKAIFFFESAFVVNSTNPMVP